jgi:DNA-binding transcriptional regulator YiaG
MAEKMQKDQAHKLVDKMPDDSTWDDLINEIYVREVIDQSLEDSRKSRTTNIHDVRNKYGLAK